MLYVLLLFFVIVLVIWYIQFRWSRRNLYKAAAKIKGPAGWPMIGNLVFVRGATHCMENLMALSNIYPDMTKLWIGPELLLCLYDPQALEIVLNSSKALAKKDLFYKCLVPVMGLGLVTGPVPRWKRHRKIIAPSFNQQVLNGFMDTFSEQCAIFVKQLEKFAANKGEFDIMAPIATCILNTTCETIMGVKADQKSISNIQSIIHRGSEILAARMTAILHQLDFIFFRTKLGKEHVKMNNLFQDFTSNIITQKREELSNKRPVTIMDGYISKKKNFLNLLLENSNFTEEELKEEVNTLFLGASDTVMISAAFTFVMLGMYPDVQNKVLEEILEVTGPHRQIELSDLPHLKYTECVIKETLRMFPPFPYLARSVEDDIPFEDGITFPKGSTILFSIFNLHRVAKYWPDPLKFNPDRFSPEEAAKRHSYCFLPFSAGPRNCIGYKYGYMILKTMVASVVRAYKISTSFEKIEDVEVKLEVTLGSKHGFPVSLETRSYL